MEPKKIATIYRCFSFSFKGVYFQVNHARSFAAIVHHKKFHNSKKVEPTCKKRWKSTDAVNASRKDQKSQTRMPGDFLPNLVYEGEP